MENFFFSWGESGLHGCGARYLGTLSAHDLVDPKVGPG